MGLLLALFLTAAQSGEPAAEPAEVCPSPIRIEPSSLLVVTPGSTLGALEKELVSLHMALRPAMVRVEIPLPVGPGPTEAEVAAGAGSPVPQKVLVSGVVIDQEGLFVAPALVAGPEDTVRVVRFDGESFEAWPLERDEEFGLTLFRSPGLGVPPPPLAWPAALRVGMVTITLGNAFGLSGSLDLGFIAGLNRRVEHTEGLLQLTNTVNPGDGGGLVANRHGQVIGLIKTSLREVGHRQIQSGCPEDCEDSCSELFRSESLSFAIPIDEVLLAFEAHLSFPVPDQHWLGVKVREKYLPALAAELQRPAPTFLALDEVLPDSPAREAGLEPGDVLIEFGGFPLVDLSCLRHALSVCPEGQPLPVVFLREGVRHEGSMALGWSPPKDLRRPARD